MYRYEKRALSKSNGVPSPLEAVKRLIATLLLWQERARVRQDLRELDQRMLDDIGIDQSEARKEADKPFWRA